MPRYKDPDELKKPVLITLHPKLLRKLDDYAEDQGMTRTAVIEEALREKLPKINAVIEINPQ